MFSHFQARLGSCSVGVLQRPQLFPRIFVFSVPLLDLCLTSMSALATAEQLVPARALVSFVLHVNLLSAFLPGWQSPH